MLEIVSRSAEETAEAGFRLGSLLRKGDVVCLSGGLGTGKTAFTGGIAEALGIHTHITSPTFTLVNEYQGRIPLYHFDVYRIAHPDEMFEIGFEEYMDGAGVVVIEWAERIRDLLPDASIQVHMEKNLKQGTEFRILTLDFIGEKYAEIREKLTSHAGSFEGVQEGRHER